MMALGAGKVGSIGNVSDHGRYQSAASYAYLQTMFGQGKRSPLDLIEPFLVYAVAHFEGKKYEPNEIAEYLREHLRIRVPLYMLSSISDRLINKGALVAVGFDKKTFICKDIIKELPDADKEIGSNDEMEYLEGAIHDYAVREGFGSGPIESKYWCDGIVRLFSGVNGSGKRVEYKGVIVDAVKVETHFLSGYVEAAEKSDTRAFETIKKIYLGICVADVLLNIQTNFSDAILNGVAIYYDSTVLMRLLGTSGTLLKDATMEMHNALQRMGCNFFYFDHTYDEVLDNLKGIESSYANSSREMFEETKNAIAKGEVRIEEIRALPSVMTRKLEQLSIKEAPPGYTDVSNRFQISEDKFAEFLSLERPRNKAAWDKDAKSLALVMRRRAGAAPRELSKSRAIFVTHNGYLARKAKDFLVDEGVITSGQIPPFMTVNQITTVTWLASDPNLENIPISKEIAIECYMAGIPDAGWEEKFLAKVREHLENSDVDQNLRDSVCYVAREIAEDESYGAETMLETLDFGEICQRAIEAIDNEHKKGVDLGARRAIDMIAGEIGLSKEGAGIDDVSAHIGLLSASAVQEGVKRERERLLQGIEDRSRHYSRRVELLTRLLALTIAVAFLLWDKQLVAFDQVKDGMLWLFITYNIGGWMYELCCGGDLRLDIFRWIERASYRKFKDAEVRKLIP